MSKFRKKLLRSAIAAVALAAAAVALAGIWYLVNPIGFRTSLFLPVREVRLFHTELQPLAAPTKIARINLPAPHSLVIPGRSPGEPPLAVDVYAESPDDFGDRPVVLLLHGGSVHGRRSGLIRLLGHRLAAHGWVGMAPDARGFGDTPDPEPKHDPGSWSVRPDIDRLLEVALARDGDPERIAVFGHSLGADHAIEAALGDPRVSAIVVASAGVYVDGETTQWQLLRFAADRGLNRVLPLDTVTRIRAAGNLNDLALGRLPMPGGSQMIILFGAEDAESMVAHYRRIGAALAPHGVELVQVPLGGHWFGVRSFFGSNTVYVREDVFDSFLVILLEILEPRSQRQLTRR